MSFQMRVKPHRLAGAVFVTEVRDSLLSMLMKRKREKGLKQADIAEALGVNRSVVNRQLTGKADLSLMRVGELAEILGCTAEFRLTPLDTPHSNNISDRVVPVLELETERNTEAAGIKRMTASARTTGNEALIKQTVKMSREYSTKQMQTNA